MPHFGAPYRTRSGPRDHVGAPAFIDLLGLRKADLPDLDLTGPREQFQPRQRPDDTSDQLGPVGISTKAPPPMMQHLSPQDESEGFSLDL